MQSGGHLKHFLQSARIAVQRKASATPDNSKFVVCVGNEAADADSIVSALSYAYLKDRESKRLSKDIYTYIPVVNIDRKYLHLRRDVEILIQFKGLSLSDLICLDELTQVDLNALAWSDRLCVVLLDHNQLSLRLQGIFDPNIPTSKYITRIIDHHKDLGDYTHLYDENRLIDFDSSASTALIGSTCTHIGELFDKSEIGHDALPDIAILLKGVILLDTLNMDPKAGKGTTRDGTMLKLLNQIESIPCDELFNRLVSSKTDIEFWRSLSISDALLLDFKDFSFNRHVVGISSVLLSIGELISKEGTEDTLLQLTDLIDDSPRELIVIMSVLNGGTKDMSREIAVISRDIHRTSEFASFLCEPSNDLQLSSVTLDMKNFAARGLSIELFNQGNIKSSRKQISVYTKDYYDKKM